MPMPSSISQDDLRIILHEADVAARRLLRRLRLSGDDLDDLRQDLLTDLVVRLPRFDRNRGSIGAFAGLVMANRATRIAKNVYRHRRMFGVLPLSIDDPLPNGDGATRGDLISEEESLAAFLGQPVNRIAGTELRLDLDRGLGTLRPSDRVFCALLVDRTPMELSRDGFGSRASLYRQVHEIRLRLMTSGLSAVA